MTIDSELIELPDLSEVGKSGYWTLPTKNGKEEVKFSGKFIGVSSTKRDRHDGHNEQDFAPYTVNCRACRWFEPRIFLDFSEEKTYLIHYAGRTIVPGEKTRSRHEIIKGAYSVVERLTSRKPTGLEDNIQTLELRIARYEELLDAARKELEILRKGGSAQQGTFLTAPIRAVLAQSADYDRGMNEAWINRAV